MGYFPNGTAGDMFEAEFCSKCVHEDDEKGCPVMLAHVLYAYDLCNEDEAKNPGKHVLEMLIVQDEKRNTQRCSMFVSVSRLKMSRARAAKHEKLEERLAELKREATR